MLHDEKLEAYLKEYSAAEDGVLTNLARETQMKVQMPQMLSGHLQGLILEMLSRLIQPKRILEIGTYTGYSAICLAKGLPTNGKLTTIDINDELHEMCQKNFAAAGLSDCIEMLVGDALELIPKLEDRFQLVFIDADKVNYCRYYELVFDMADSGSYIVADNVLWSGKVLEEKQDASTAAIHNFNVMVKNDARVTNFILPIRDGLNIIRKL